MLSNNSTITRSTAIGAKKTLINKQKTSWQGILYQYHSTTPFNGLWSQYIPFQITNGVQSYYVLKTKSDSSINDGFNKPIIGRLKKKIHHSSEDPSLSNSNSGKLQHSCAHISASLSLWPVLQPHLLVASQLP